MNTPPFEVRRMGEADPSRLDFKARDLTICLIRGSSLVMIVAIVDSELNWAKFLGSDFGTEWTQ